MDNKAQVQPVINKIFSEMEKESRWSEQLRFLILCRQKGIIPKGMRTKISGNLATSEYERRLKRNHEMKILRRNISELHGKRRDVTKKISQLKLNLQETLECRETSLKISGLVQTHLPFWEFSTQ